MALALRSPAPGAPAHEVLAPCPRAGKRSALWAGRGCGRVLRHVRAVLGDGLNQVIFGKEVGNLHRLPPVDRRTAVHEPVRRGLARERVLERPPVHLALARHLHARQAVLIVAQGVGIRRVRRCS